MTREQQRWEIVRRLAPNDGSGSLGRRCREELYDLEETFRREDLNARVPELMKIEADRAKMWARIQKMCTTA